MRIETESGVIQAQAKRHLEPPKAVRGEDGSSPRVSRGIRALLTP